jgi:DNA polymerase III epsilon subunit-like protein
MSNFFQPGVVTRTASGVPAQDVEWAAIDIETTGLEPQRDRIVEIAIVRFHSSGTVVDEYSTLVNPERRMGGGEIHQLTGRDVADAPTFTEVWPDIVRMLSGAVALAHNLSFEDGFIAVESARVTPVAMGFPGVCSLNTARAQLAGKTFRLMSLHKTFTGEWIEDQHTALGDARALAQIWPAMLNQAPFRLFYRGPAPVTIAPSARPMGRIAPRPVEVSSPRLGEFTRRFPRCSVEYVVAPVVLEQYMAALREVVDDEIITVEESVRLEELARRAGLTQQALEAAHRQVWETLTGQTPDGPAPTRAQQLRRDRLATNLGLTGSAKRSPELVAQMNAAALQPRPDRYLRDWRIGIDPAPETEPLTALASRHGASIAKRLSATVRWVATADPDGSTPTVIRARALGLRIITTAQAESALDEHIAAAKVREGEWIAAQERWQHERDERDQLFRHTWLDVERSADVLDDVRVARHPVNTRWVSQPVTVGPTAYAPPRGSSIPPTYAAVPPLRPMMMPGRGPFVGMLKKPWWKRIFGR